MDDASTILTENFLSILIIFLLVATLTYILTQRYQSPPDSEPLATITTILGVTTCFCTIAFLPVDVRTSASFLDSRTGLAASWATPQVKKELLDVAKVSYLVLYGAAAVCTVVLSPFSYFYFEEGDDTSWRRRLGNALKYTVITVAVVVLLMLIGLVVGPGAAHYGGIPGGGRDREGLGGGGDRDSRDNESPEPVKPGLSDGWPWDLLKLRHPSLEEASLFITASLILLGMGVYATYTAYGLAALPIFALAEMQHFKKDPRINAPPRGGESSPIDDSTYLGPRNYDSLTSTQARNWQTHAPYPVRSQTASSAFSVATTSSAQDTPRRVVASARTPVEQQLMLVRERIRSLTHQQLPGQMGMSYTSKQTESPTSRTGSEPGTWNKMREVDKYSLLAELHEQESELLRQTAASSDSDPCRNPQEVRPIQLPWYRRFPFLPRPSDRSSSAQRPRHWANESYSVAFYFKKKLWRPAFFILGCLSGALSLSIVVSVVFELVDKARNSICGTDCGYVVGRALEYVPVDALLVWLSKFSPADHIFFALLVFYLPIATLFGVISIGIRVLWLRVFSIRLHGTPPQALLLASVILMLGLLAQGYSVVHMIAPGYASWGNQRFCSVPEEGCIGKPASMQRCSFDGPQDLCTPSALSHLIHRILITTPFFGTGYYYAQYAFVLSFVFSNVIAMYRARNRLRNIRRGRRRRRGRRGRERGRGRLRGDDEEDEGSERAWLL